MNLNRTAATTTTLALIGCALWALGATKLSANGELNFSPNPLGVKESAYGQILALAAQGGIETDWRYVETNGGSLKKSNEAPDLVGRLQQSVMQRTNPSPASAGYKFYLRRQVENRLRMAYELDPSNYTNYNAYHFFLTEPSFGTRPVLNDQILQLADYTHRYCMKERNDPRPALTAAGAAGNILLLMFAHKEDYSIDQMRERLVLMDQAIERHAELADLWQKDGQMENLSPDRQEEMAERVKFVTQMRKSAAATLSHLASAQACR